MSNSPDTHKDIREAVEEVLIKLWNTVDIEDVDEGLIDVGAVDDSADAILALHQKEVDKIVEAVIKGNEEMTFNNEVPIFLHLEEWMDRVALIRETLREEQRKRYEALKRGGK